MKKHLIVSTILLAPLMTGCGGGTNNCSDSETKEAVISIITDQMIKMGETFKSKVTYFRVAKIQTLSHNSELDSYECQAAYQFGAPLSNGNIRDVSIDIQYSTSWLEDEKDTLVSVYNTSTLQNFISRLYNGIY